jgi:hypothetical protein
VNTKIIRLFLRNSSYWCHVSMLHIFHSLEIILHQFSHPVLSGLEDISDEDTFPFNLYFIALQNCMKQPNSFTSVIIRLQNKS